jgi:hypothetical protein
MDTHSKSINKRRCQPLPNDIRGEWVGGYRPAKKSLFLAGASDLIASTSEKAIFRQWLYRSRTLTA